MLRQHRVELVAHRPELARRPRGRPRSASSKLAVAQQQVAAQELAVGDVAAVGRGDAQHLERALGARGVAHADVDPGDLVERDVEHGGGARHALVGLDA